MSKAHCIPSERSFGLSVGFAGTAAGALLMWRGHSAVGMGLTTVGIVLAFAGLVAPAALRIPNRVWWRFALVLAWINARVLFTIVFFVVLTPAGGLMRLVGRNPLRPVPSNTNWSEYAARRRDPRHYEHLY